MSPGTVSAFAEFAEITLLTIEKLRPIFDPTAIMIEAFKHKERRI